MSVAKRYTNATWTRRVDHAGGRHRPPRAFSEALAHALNKAYDGDVHCGFSHENKLARVWWHR